MNNIKEFLNGKIIEFQGFSCYAIARPYNSGKVHLHLYDLNDKLAVARCSLDVDQIPTIENMIIVKSYSENDGMYEALLKAGIIKPCERTYEIGFEEAHICFFDLPI